MKRVMFCELTGTAPSLINRGNAIFHSVFYRKQMETSSREKNPGGRRAVLHALLYDRLLSHGGRNIIEDLVILSCHLYDTFLVMNS